MNTIAIFSTWISTAAIVVAQGTVIFANRVPWARPPVDAPFFDERGRPLIGTNYLAQLYAGSSMQSLESIGTPDPFVTNGYFYVQERPYSETVRTLPMVRLGAPAWVQVRAWEASGGPTFEDAALAGKWTGTSEILFLDATGHGGINPTPPRELIGLKYPGRPIIVREPKNQRIRAGEKANLSVVASGGVAVSYQWHQGLGGDASRPVSGATNITLTTSPLSVDTSFWVKVTTSVGSTNSAAAMVTVLPANAARLSLRLVSGVPSLSIDGVVGTTYRIDYKPDLSASEWTALESISLPSNPFTFQDTTATGAEARFYRVVVP